MATVADCVKRFMTWQWSTPVKRFICAVSRRAQRPAIARQARPARAGARAAGLRLAVCFLACWSLARAGDTEQTGIDYQRDIQPLFDRYCVACHACLDAPCQLDLTHPAGVKRGASTRPVYDGARLEAAQPTRLFIDARSEAEWRGKAFFPVVSAADASSILLKVLDLRARYPLAADRPLPDGIELGIRRTNQCVNPEQARQLGAEGAHLGMPFALPGMTDAEVDRVRRWIGQGAQIDTEPPPITVGERDQIRHWEAWLNSAVPERALVARWLYEHWAIARLYFDGAASGNFFRLVRSSTPPGRPVDEIVTRFANSDPEGVFYYRLRLQPGTRVAKTHITFALDAKVLQRIEELFFARDWHAGELPGYDTRERANPFTTFAAIPAEARYGFLLEHAEYFVRTFIRGPVCRGQLATDVIRDHFWVMFQAPASDPYIVDGRFRHTADALLALPGVEDDLLEGAETWIESTEARNRYAALRQEALAALHPRGAALTSIWNGGGTNQNALLTVFRHHDSATVKRGWLGQKPFTLWWLDFPLFERSYYNLVVNFDVFGNLAHQAQTRLYFDLIRNGAEQNFLRLLPAAARQDVLDTWYAGAGKLKLWLSYQSIDTERDSAVAYRTDAPQDELLDTLLSQFVPINAAPDPVNRGASMEARVGSSGQASNAASDALLRRLSNVRAADMPAIAHLPDATILQIDGPDGRPDIYTLVRNRRHSNVAFVLGESLRYEPHKDTLTVVPGVATVYPNFMFAVPVDQLSIFVSMLTDKALADRTSFVERVVAVWGVRRSSPEFWSRFHAVNRHLYETDPVEAGMLDLNRYVDY